MSRFENVLISMKCGTSYANVNLKMSRFENESIQLIHGTSFENLKISQRLILASKNAYEARKIKTAFVAFSLRALR